MDDHTKSEISEEIEDIRKLLSQVKYLWEGYLAGQMCHLKSKRQDNGVHIPNKGLSWLDTVDHRLAVIVTNKLR